MAELTEMSWRIQAAHKLQQFKQWLPAGDGPYPVYGTVAGLSLWPLVETAARTPPGPLPGSVYLALGSVAGGVGSNLIAEQLQKWRDPAKAITEDQVITWVRENVVTQEPLRRALALVLEKLDAVAQVQASLQENDRLWFTRVWQQEQDGWGNIKQYHATLQGSGAVAQGASSTAVGERGISITGNVAGPIITGDSTGAIGPPNLAETSALLPAVLVPLRDQMVASFSKDELHSLAFTLRIAYDDLPGVTRTELAESLIAFCHRYRHLPTLLGECRRLRPAINWPTVP